MSYARRLPIITFATLATLALALTGCTIASVPNQAPRPASYALDEPEMSQLGELYRRQAAGDGASGFAALTQPRDAFLSLYTLAKLSEKTLDVQYYIWRRDHTGRVLLSALMEAADRGVRVRMLLDDKDLSWPVDELARLNAHPNFEVRLFNPFIDRGTRLFDYLFDFSRITHRMHNKALIADNTPTTRQGKVRWPYMVERGRGPGRQAEQAGDVEG
jgi:putative cardiolipin synthase